MKGLTVWDSLSMPNIWNGNLERSGFRVLLLFLLLLQLLLLLPLLLLSLLLLLLLLLLLGKGQLSIIIASIAAVKVSNNLNF
jgi:hypothetical protein